MHYTGKQSAHLYANEEQLHDPYLSPTRITAFDTIPVEASNANAPMWQVLGTSDSKLQVRDRLNGTLLAPKHQGPPTRRTPVASPEAPAWR